MKIIQSIFLCLSITGLVFPCLFLPSLAISGAARDHLENFLDTTNDMNAEFKQTLYDADGRTLQKSHGRFYLSRPGKFRWDYISPIVQNIISDGEHVWIFDTELEQVMVQTRSKAMGNTPLLLIENREPLDKSFFVHELDSQNGLFRVELQSKTGATDFQRITLAFDENNLRVMELHDALEQKTIIEFEKIQINQPQSENLFTFEPPPGVDVIGEY